VLLGRSAGLTEAQIAHLGDDPLPEGVYGDDGAAIVRYAQASHRSQPISDEVYDDLRRHFSNEEVIDLCFVIGLSNLVNRFHATFLTDLDDRTADAVGASCPLPLPPTPTVTEG
jgi:alkylhydroperoxidase family enzyme